MALSTALGLSRRGFFIPYRYAGAVPAPGERPPYRSLEALFARHEAAFETVLEAIDRHAEPLLALGHAPPPAPRWDQDWFPGLDAAVAYALVRERAPRALVEVGSGHSTRFLARAMADGGLPDPIAAIDPAPRASLAGLEGVELIRATLQEAGLAPFEALRAGGLLFVDSSHILMPGSDVDFLLNRVLPQLGTGTLIHIHDIFLPDDYPVAWAWRGYNEQSAVAALLQGGGYAPLFSSHYVSTRMAARLEGHTARRLPLPPDAIESSLWLEKRGT